MDGEFYATAVCQHRVLSELARVFSVILTGNWNTAIVDVLFRTLKNLMKLAFQIILGVCLLAFVLFYFTIDQNGETASEMPWQITLHDQDHLEVFGIVLNQTTLQQAREQFGQLEGIALYQSEQGLYNLEAYFGKLAIGRFNARLIANLEASQDELEALTLHTVKRVKTEEGSMRWTLNADKQQEQGLRKIRTLSYIPDYSDLGADFIRQHFGEPDSFSVVNDTTQLWVYPQRGVRILIDTQGKELFEYMAPSRFKRLEENN